MSNNNQAVYARLCDAVREIDEQAYQYMISDKCINQPLFKYTIRLTNAFVFDDSPQGGEYWIEIASKLKPPYIREELYQTLQKIEQFANEVKAVKNETQKN